MPNKRHNKGGRGWISDGPKGREVKYYYEHDDRDVGQNMRKVSIKSGGGHRVEKRGKRGRDITIISRIEDEDVEMGGPSGAGRYSAYNNHGRVRNRGRSDRPGKWNDGRGRSSPRRKLLENVTSWYKITLPHSGKYDKEYIMKVLGSFIEPTPLVPIAYKVQGNAVTFFVEEFITADKLYNADKRITTIDGSKIVIQVRPGFPTIEIDSKLKERMKEVMAKRFNLPLKALDLSRFHRDPDFVDDYAVVLSRTNVLVAVVDIIMANIPELFALNLSDNKLTNIEHLNIIPKKIPHIRFLDIGKNKIREWSQIDHLQGLPLEELILNGNPICGKVKDKNQYVSEVRKRFPKVLKLDGVELPPPILFDVDDNFKIPPSRGSFICRPEAVDVVRRFVEEYFRVYDSGNRLGLADAYHESAMFSLTSTYSPGHTVYGSEKLSTYIADSRNLLRVKDTPRRMKLLFKGKQAVVAMLAKLPKTEHDPLSFTVDVPFFMEHLILISLSGIFAETEHTSHHRPLRSFNRVFTIVPYGAGFCIINEVYYVTNATEEQSKVAFKAQPIVASPPVPAPIPVPVPDVLIPIIDEQTRQQMVEAVAANTGMNLDWSRKCLDETSWDFQRAITVFTELNKEGKVPAEAFIK